MQFILIYYKIWYLITFIVITQMMVLSIILEKKIYYSFVNKYSKQFIYRVNSL